MRHVYRAVSSMERLSDVFEEKRINEKERQ